MLTEMNQCPKEIRTVTAYQTVAGTPVLIYKNSAGFSEVLEITMQPDADCQLQLSEGSNSQPMSLLCFVHADEMWSAPGKVVYDNLYLTCLETGINMQVEVRSIAGQG